MDNTEQAIDTFKKVPEVYQQIFIKNNADFPDELVTEIKKNPSQVDSLLEQDPQLKKAIVNIFNNNKQVILQSMQQSNIFKKGGKMAFGLQKFQAGGSFYNNWTADDIRKLQNRLYAKGFYRGDLDGIVGPQTIAAVKAYQKAHGLKEDGLFGHNTNSIEKLMDASVMDKGSYKVSHKTEQGDLVQHTGNPTALTLKNFTPKQIQDFEVYYYNHPEEFFDPNNANASKWRTILNNSGDSGKSTIEMIYGMLTPEQRKQVGSLQKTDRIKSDEVTDSVNTTRNKTARTIGPILAAPVALGELLAGATGGAALTSMGGLTGGLLGGLAGGAYGEAAGKDAGKVKSKHKDENGYTNVYHDPVAERYGVAFAEYNPERQIQESGQRGRSIGAIVGSILGSGLGAGASTDAQVTYLNRLNRGHANLNYNDPVTVVEGQVAPYGYVTTNSVGRGNAAVYAEGATRPKVTEGSARVGGPHGLTVNYNGTTLNPGSFANQDIINAASTRWNNMNSPVIVKFGTQPNTGLSSKLGNGYVQNIRGVLLNAGMDTPATLITNDAVGIYKRGGNIESTIGKYQHGKKLNKNIYHTIISAPGDTLDTKYYKYSTTTRQTYPNNAVVFEDYGNSYYNKYYDPRRTPLTLWQRLMNGFPKPAPKSLLENWDKLKINHKNDTNVLDKTKK